MDRIRMRGLRFFGYHGVLATEAEEGQPFIVDLDLYADLARAGASDALDQTVDYAAVYRIVRQIVEGQRRQLIEAVAETIAAELLTALPALQSVRVVVHKPQAPLPGEFEDVAVEIVRKRRRRNE